VTSSDLKNFKKFLRSVQLHELGIHTSKAGSVGGGAGSEERGFPSCQQTGHMLQVFHTVAGDAVFWDL